ncbi:unknown protein [Seminavis robusta]|uniref:BACK domain-containing protein n=1 Tax=Seminavis robusta TaxID=568900 RepID=A0A9N8EVZ1_9STRA|nr:unknown protein [Seminavis robusta]|eukprot:Sro2059_g312890.1 n/a (317) ;mRNA; f:3926-4935
MHEIVEYVHTDTCTSLNGKKRKACDENKAKQWDAQKELAEKVVGLSAAAMHYNLPNLVKKIKQTLLNLMQNTPSLFLMVLATCHKEGPSVPSALLEIAWSFVRTNKTTLTDSKAIACVDATLVEEILKDEKLEMDEYTLFVFLTQWVDSNPNERQAIAKNLGSNLGLEKINPAYLSTSVVSSGLFMPDQINEASKIKLCMLNKPTKSHFNMTDSSLDGKNLSLQRLVMMEGIHEWTVKLLDDNDGGGASAVIGIVCDETFVDNGSLLYTQKGGWGYDDFGNAYSEGKPVNPNRLSTIGLGTDVKLTLNLSPRNGQP